MISGQKQTTENTTKIYTKNKTTIQLLHHTNKLWKLTKKLACHDAGMFTNVCLQLAANWHSAVQLVPFETARIK